MAEVAAGSGGPWLRGPSTTVAMRFPRKPKGWGLAHGLRGSVSGPLRRWGGARKLDTAISRLLGASLTPAQAPLQTPHTPSPDRHSAHMHALRVPATARPSPNATGLFNNDPPQKPGARDTVRHASFACRPKPWVALPP